MAKQWIDADDQRVRTAPEAVDTGALVREVIELAAPTGDTVIDVDPDMPIVHAEKVPLQQVFLNLITNAVKYTRVARPDVRVHVGWRAGREAYEFYVKDNGPGIAPEYHERVWGIFQTLQANLGDVAVRHETAGERPADALAFRALVLEHFEGRSDEAVALEQASAGKGK